MKTAKPKNTKGGAREGAGRKKGDLVKVAAKIKESSRAWYQAEAERRGISEHAILSEALEAGVKR